MLFFKWLGLGLRKQCHMIQDGPMHCNGPMAQGQVLIREERFIRGCLVFTVLYKGTHAQIDALNISLVLF